MEFLDAGPERAPRLRGRRPSGQWRPRPFVAVLLLAVAAATVWVGYAVTAPKIPAVRVSAANSQAGASQASAPWRPAADGRPASGVELQVAAVISAVHPPGDRLTVLGMVGPGVIGGLSHPVVVPAGNEIPVLLVAELDCSQVHFPVRESDYRIKVQVVAGSRGTTGSVAGGGTSSVWASSVERACGSWLARRDLTVVQASATLDPKQPSAELTLMIENRDARAAYLGLGWFGSLDVSARSPGEMVLAGGQTSTLHLHVAVGNCDSVPPPVAELSGDFTTTADYLGIAALVGTRPQAPHPDSALSPLDGTVPTGIVIAPGPRTAIAESLRAACADLDQFVTLIAAHGLTLDKKTGVMTVRINIDGTPGKVRDVQLISDPPAADNTAFEPLWTVVPGLVPDASGQVTVLLPYRVPARGASPCPSLGAWIPGFTLVAHVSSGNTVKTLRYSQYIDPSQDPAAIKTLCPFGTPFP